MIRPVTLSDAERITEIYNHYIAETTISFETEPLTVAQMEARINDISAHHPYFIYESNGMILGYCYAHPWKERAAYSATLETTIYLDKDATHRGIGRQLMQHLIEACRAKGFHALIACITADNAPSITLHKELGFRQVSLFKEVGRKFDRLLDVVDMELLL